MVARVQELAVEGLSGPEIRRSLEGDMEFADKRALPSVRTIQDLAREVARPADSTLWTLAAQAEDPDDAALVMPVLAELVGRSGIGAIR
jgi:hypothetical protein